MARALDLQSCLSTLFRSSLVLFLTVAVRFLQCDGSYSCLFVFADYRRVLRLPWPALRVESTATDKAALWRQVRVARHAPQHSSRFPQGTGPVFRQTCVLR
eukprot:716503-Pleurochrysis_carterae.AAC.2